MDGMDLESVTMDNHHHHPIAELDLQKCTHDMTFPPIAHNDKCLCMKVCLKLLLFKL